MSDDDAANPADETVTPATESDSDAPAPVHESASRRSQGETDDEAASGDERPARAGDDTGANPDGDPATPPRTRSPHRTRKLILWLLALLVAIAVAVAGLTYLHVRHSLGNIPRNTGFLPTSTDRPAVPDGPMTFLLLGADNRESDPDDPGRSDTMMLGYIPKDRKHVYLISITRDMWVPIHGGGYAKINAAYADGGVPLTVQTVEDLFGVGIQHVALMDFEGFMKMTDTLGGVDVWNDTEFTDSADMGCVFPVGWYTVKGDCGLAFVRERHNSPDGDLGRAARQRATVRAIVGKAMGAGALANPVKANAMLSTVANTFVLDNKFSDDDIISLAGSLKLGSSSDVRTLQLPIGGYDTSLDGQDINVPDKEQLAELALALRTDAMDGWWATHDPNNDFTDNPAWPVGQGAAPYGTPSPRPKVPQATATPWANGGQTANPSASASRKKR